MHAPPRALLARGRFLDAESLRFEQVDNHRPLQASDVLLGSGNLLPEHLEASLHGIPGFGSQVPGPVEILEFLQGNPRISPRIRQGHLDSLNESHGTPQEVFEPGFLGL